MADAPYTPSMNELKDCALSYSALMSEASFDRVIAAHVADEVERLADEIDRACQSMPNWPGWTHNWDKIESFAHGVVDSAEHVRARAAELRKEQ